VRVVTGDTGITPVDLGSYSSRVTIMAGNAALQAADRLRATIAAWFPRRSARCPIASCSRKAGVRGRPAGRQA
jgi:CO/xanthine dehydrogenase Mo-binding subunit